MLLFYFVLKMEISGDKLKVKVIGFKEYLENVINERKPCEQMQTFLNGKQKEHMDLNFNFPMGQFTEEQHELVIEP